MNARYLIAAIAYVVLGGLVIALTLLTPGMSGPNRRAEIAHMLAGTPFILIFGAFVAWGDRALAGATRWLLGGERSTRFGASARRSVTVLLGVTAAVRAGVFACNGFGLRPRLGPLRFEAASADPTMWLAAGAMTVISALMFRASLGAQQRPASRSKRPTP